MGNRGGPGAGGGRQSEHPQGRRAACRFPAAATRLPSRARHCCWRSSFDAAGLGRGGPRGSDDSLGCATAPIKRLHRVLESLSRFLIRAQLAGSAARFQGARHGPAAAAGGLPTIAMAAGPASCCEGNRDPHQGRRHEFPRSLAGPAIGQTGRAQAVRPARPCVRARSRRSSSMPCGSDWRAACRRGGIRSAAVAMPLEADLQPGGPGRVRCTIR